MAPMKFQLVHEGSPTVPMDGDRIILDPAQKRAGLFRRGRALRIRGEEESILFEESFFEKPDTSGDPIIVRRVMRRTRGWSARFLLIRTPYTEAEETFFCFEIILPVLLPSASTQGGA